ncbi:NAD+ nucleosidase [Fasciolopsis buskii]|uniref:NAD+ nucleosidase n=1 Tax=Fasciolopsis buskii TaxID=27845 RepID=A0A8E0RUB1_9TREM|nr:NAD+ nucleosidase [Fasciolopsis buski]
MECMGIVTRNFLLALNLFVACTAGQQASEFERIVKGRCADWGRMFGVERISCDQFWTDFEKVFTEESIQKLCVMDPQLYDPLVASMFAFVPEINKNGFFWSKTKTVTLPLCKQLGLFHCLERTLPGYIFDGLNWCDETLTGGKKYETQCGCTRKSEVVYAFWKSVSSAYVKKLSGSVGVMLNGSISTPFLQNTTFGSIEVPHIKPPQFQNVTVYVVKNLDDDASG